MEFRQGEPRPGWAGGEGGRDPSPARRAVGGGPRPLVDPFGRAITYLRMSVTDRCDFRCGYCMAEEMTFLPKAELLTLEELERLGGIFVRLGVRKLRLTGGEPLVRRNIMQLFRGLARHLDSGDLDELTLTTNASQLDRHADELAALGVRRVNVSLDSLDRARFAHITRRDRFDRVMAGLEAARRAGLKIKINTVALKNLNLGEIDDLIAWCGAHGQEMTLIEVMPMGEMEAGARTDQYKSLSELRAELEARWTLIDLPDRTGGPARYVRVAETGERLGFITPLSHNFCESCNRVRVTCTGRLYMCLGQEDAADLRGVLRDHPEDDAPAIAAIRAAIARKPRGHDFVIERGRDGAAVPRHMNVTGG